ncbi:MAG: hypothetical protein FWC72_04780, partial [Oscillospiraceae bacterium]|nr:hypothetical protein [Oscillospiraceae bacterium]
MRRRLIAILLVICTVFTLLPTAALGTEMVSITFVTRFHGLSTFREQVVSVPLGARYGEAFAQAEIGIPPVEGHYFVSWFDASALFHVLETRLVTADSPRRLHASWSSRPTLDMTFHGYDNTWRPWPLYTAELGETYAAVLDRVSQPLRGGYVFTGWFAHELAGGAALQPSDLVTATSERWFYARWEPIDFADFTDIPAGAWFEKAVQF